MDAYATQGISRERSHIQARMKKLMALIAAAITFTVLAAAPASASSPTIGCLGFDNGREWTQQCFQAGEMPAAWHLG
nr:hypothetical protein GCM10020092_069310 [Actinoplanes digitatis]